MTRLNKIERLKDELYAGDYKVVKNAELLAKGLIDAPIEDIEEGGEDDGLL